MTTFEGFADSEGKFFGALARKNDRAWFQAHKAEFEEGWNAPLNALLADVRRRIDRAYPHSDLDEPRVFRIFRDVRFAKDKSPYKAHLGGYVPLKIGARKTTDLPMALYFQVGAKETFAAAGHYMMEPSALVRFRAAVAEEERGKELVKILGALSKKGFPSKSHDALKRVPKGYAPDHPRADLLKRKGLVVMFPDVPKRLLTSPDLATWLANGCKTAAPLVEWLAFATS